ncbi:hypothetical protein MA16_Dca014493 [Dendrobium catenatum]|uniref:Uncharacterized protein n=1 Tax=Dendrobium catenatum TaxID=906689 RepID=A0A2I0W306_9ASPA|nr:hypothetical protein MA16_Dca014493 [Dendrobium catenatum]
MEEVESLVLESNHSKVVEQGTILSSVVGEPGVLEKENMFFILQKVDKDRKEDNSEGSSMVDKEEGELEDNGIKKKEEDVPKDLKNVIGQGLEALTTFYGVYWWVGSSVSLPPSVKRFSPTSSSSPSSEE